MRQDGSAEFSNVTIRGGLIEGAPGLYYNGTPAAHNLIASVGATAGADDGFGNITLAGAVTYHFVTSGPFGSVAIAVNDGSITWYTSPAGSLGPWTQFASETVGSAGLSVSAPGFRFSNGADSNSYRIGSLVLPANAVPQTISSVTAADVAGCQASIGAIAYRVRAVIQYAGNQAAGVPNFQIGLGAGAASVIWANAEFHDAVAGTSGYVARPASWGPFAGPVLSTNNWEAVIEGYAVFTAGGNISLQAWTSIAADTFVIKNAFLELTPV